MSQCCDIHQTSAFYNVIVYVDGLKKGIHLLSIVLCLEIYLTIEAYLLLSVLQDCYRVSVHIDSVEVSARHSTKCQSGMESVEFSNVLK